MTNANLYMPHPCGFIAGFSLHTQMLQSNTKKHLFYCSIYFIHCTWNHFLRHLLEKSDISKTCKRQVYKTKLKLIRTLSLNSYLPRMTEDVFTSSVRSTRRAVHSASVCWDLVKLTVAACDSVACPFSVSRHRVLQFAVEQCFPGYQRIFPASAACCPLCQTSYNAHRANCQLLIYK